MKKLISLVAFMVILIFLLYSCKKDITTSVPSLNLTDTVKSDWVNLMPNSFILAMTLDNAGDVWCVTTNQIAEMLPDYSIITLANSNILGQCIGFDTLTNDLWVGTSTGAFKFDGNTWTGYLSGTFVNSITVEKSGTIWFANWGNVMAYDGINWTTYTTSDGLCGTIVRCTAIDSKGIKWFGTQGNGVSQFDGTTWTTYNTSNSGLASDTVYSITVDNQNNKWIATSRGLSKLDGTQWTTYLPYSNLSELVIDKNNVIWGSGLGVTIFNGSTSFVYDTNNSGLINNVVTSLVIDGQNRKWFGTLGFGISVVKN